jgi:hypothetical protein
LDPKKVVLKVRGWRLLSTYEVRFYSYFKDEARQTFSLLPDNPIRDSIRESQRSNFRHRTKVAPYKPII